MSSLLKTALCVLTAFLLLFAKISSAQFGNVGSTPPLPKTGEPKRKLFRIRIQLLRQVLTP